MQNSDQIQRLFSELARNVDELQVALSRQAVNMIAPEIAGQAEDIRRQVDRLGRELGTIEGNLRKVRGMVDIGQILNSSLNTGMVLENVMDIIIQMTHAERGFLMLRDQQGEFATRIARNWEQDSITESESQISKSIIRRVMADGQPILTTNAKEDPRFNRQDSVVAFNLRSILCVPLIVKSEILGVIYTDHRIQTGIFSEADRESLSAFANQAAIAIENARLYASIQQTLAETTALKNLMDSVFTSIGSGVFTTDENRKVIFCNPAARRMFGLHPGLLLDPYLQRHFPDLASRLLPYLDQVQNHEAFIAGMELHPHLPERGDLDLVFDIAPLRDPRQKKIRGLTVVVEDQTETARLRTSQRLFERMLSPDVISQLDPNNISLGGERALITVLFADISGFTSLGESVSPETLVAVVNCYLSAAAEAVLELGGTIDKFLGDSVMAWFNAPIQYEDHALRAIQAALRIRATLPSIHCQFPDEFKLNFSIGIHTGEAVLGMIGSEKRMEYTAVGDSVNIAKRLQERAGSDQIIISDNTYQRVHERVRTRQLEPCDLRGRKEQIILHEVLGLVEEPGSQDRQDEEKPADSEP